MKRHDLLHTKPIILDGAWGTQLQKYQSGSFSCFEKWNLDHPDWVSAVAQSYVQAGSQIILTNTFQGNRIVLERHGLAGQTKAINTRGAEISKEAAGTAALVFGSMGPSGKLLFMGDASEKELHETFREQATALAAGGVDGIVIETMSDLAEALIALRAAKETGLPVAVSMVFDSGPELDRTMMGLSPADIAAALEQGGADIIGANCGAGIADVLSVCRQLGAATAKPLWIKPNAGLPVLEGDAIVYHTTADEFASFLPALLEAGACFIGGCCGTTPEFIRQLKKRLKSEG
jgi:5-methyltetrahydrofolate--homocysteine methyltransferase